MPDTELERLDIDKPLWNQNSFCGRLKHFAWVTDSRSAFNSTKNLEDAKTLVEKYRLNQEPPGTSKEQILRAKKLYESAYHPDSGDLQNVIGRMSFQVPGGMILTAGMLQFYRTNTAVIFWQWANQSFNALVNYTNRNAASSLTTKQIAVAYVSATSSALITAVGLKTYLAKSASPLLQRYVPFSAVAAANMVNIPLSRQNELMEGVALLDENGNTIVESKYAAKKGISQVVFSRIVMAAPGMLIMPLIMERLEKRPWFMKYPSMHMPFQTTMIGAFLTFMIPVGCALFPQISTISLEKLKSVEPKNYQTVVDKFGNDNLPTVLYFNKGRELRKQFGACSG